MNMDNITPVYECSNCSNISGTWIMKPTPEVENLEYFLHTCGNVFGIFSILLNILFVFTVRFIKEKTSAYYCYIQNLAIADIFAAITFFINHHWPQWSHMLVDPEEHFFLGHGLGFVCRSTPWLFFTAYLLTLCCLTFNQFLAVCKPLRYNTVTQKKVKASLIVIWCVSSFQLLVPVIMFSVLSTLDNKIQAYNILYKMSYIEMHVWMGFFALTIFANMLVNGITYCKIKQLKHQCENIRSRTDRLTISSKQEAQITLMLLLFASSMCRLPFPIMAIISLNIDFDTTGASAVKLIDSFIVFLLYANFLVDPIIIACRTREVKVTLQTFFMVCRRRYKCCRQQQTGEMIQLKDQRTFFSMTTRGVDV